MYMDCLQYVAPSRRVFEQMRQGAVDAVHITVGYHEDFDQVVQNLANWNQWFETCGDLIARATCTDDILAAQKAGKTAIFFGLQNPLPLGTDLGRVQVLHQLGIRFCQVTYNQQSLLGAGCFESHDGGLTDFGREAVAEMNRVGMVIDLSHASPKTCLQTIETSTRPVAVTHANPWDWRNVPRNLKADVLDALFDRGGMLGFSLYPHHLKDGSDCTLDQFATMVRTLVDQYSASHFGIGSDLCQDQPDSVVQWMRNGHWRKSPDLTATFPTPPSWFTDNRDFPGLAQGLRDAGLTDGAVAGVLGQNWFDFLQKAFAPR